MIFIKCVNLTYHLRLILLLTGFGKTGFIAHDSRFDFSPRTQSYMNKLSNLTIKSARIKRSAFAYCFFQAQWQSVRCLWSSGQPGGGYMLLHSSVVLN